MLHILASLSIRNSTETLEVLLKNGADPNLSDGQGMSAFHLAVLYGNVGVFNYFLERKSQLGVDVN